jgi:hypothetical protein
MNPCSEINEKRQEGKRERDEQNLLMIISASYKTDTPAFYGDWFMNRLRAGYYYAVRRG